MSRRDLHESASPSAFTAFSWCPWKSCRRRRIAVSMGSAAETIGWGQSGSHLAIKHFCVLNVPMEGKKTLKVENKLRWKGLKSFPLHTNQKYFPSTLKALLVIQPSFFCVFFPTHYFHYYKGTLCEALLKNWQKLTLNSHQEVFPRIRHKSQWTAGKST